MYEYKEVWDSLRIFIINFIIIIYNINNITQEQYLRPYVALQTGGLHPRNLMCFLNKERKSLLSLINYDTTLIEWLR